MKFNLSTILLLIALICVSLGWFVDRRTYIDGKRLEEQLNNRSAIGSRTGSVIMSNRIYGNLESLPANEFADERNFHLIGNVICMAMNNIEASKPTKLTPDIPVPTWKKSLYLSSGAESLRLLDIETVEEFSKLCLKTIANFDSETVRSSISEEGVLDPEIANFIEQAMQIR